MADLNVPLKDSYIGKVADALKPYVTELKAKNFDPTARIAELSGAGETIEIAVKARKLAELAAAAAVQNEHNVREAFYTTATGTISLVEGLLGKTHLLPIALRSLRADLIGNQNPDGTPDPTPPAK